MCTKILIIQAETSTLTSFTREVLKRFPTSHLLENRILTAKEFECSTLIIHIHSAVKIYADKSCRAYAMENGAEAYTTKNGAWAIRSKSSKKDWTIKLIIKKPQVSWGFL